MAFMIAFMSVLLLFLTNGGNDGLFPERIIVFTNSGSGRPRVPAEIGSYEYVQLPFDKR